jgi:hypothetical protein
MRTRAATILACALVTVAAAAPRAGADSASAGPGDPVRLLGMDVAAALAELGAPRDVFPFRGTEPERDAVVFFYPGDALYLFWYRSRVWQVRFDRRHPGAVFGLALGARREEIARTYPRQLLVRGDSLYFDLDGAPFPVRVRLVFDAGVLSDLYVYRSDM